jgi:predicted TIM-barrel fold metal-dependent hydrolase
MQRTFSRRTFLGTAVAAGATILAEPRRLVAQTGSARSQVIDCHVHLKHGDATRSEWSARSIIEIMDAAGVDKSIVFAMCTTTKRSIEMAEEAVAQYPGRLIPFAYALPNYERPVLKELEAALAGGLFQGFKVHAGECTLADYVIDPVVKLAGRFGVPCLIDVKGEVPVAKRLAATFPDTHLIYPHMGRWGSKDSKLVDDFINLAGEYDNVSLDTSGVVLDAKIGEAVQRIGAGKIIWGTDGPYAHPTLVDFVKDELKKVRELSISQADKERILNGNITKLLKKV